MLSLSALLVAATGLTAFDRAAVAQSFERFDRNRPAAAARAPARAPVARGPVHGPAMRGAGAQMPAARGPAPQGPIARMPPAGGPMGRAPAYGAPPMGPGPAGPAPGPAMRGPAGLPPAAHATGPGGPRVGPPRPDFSTASRGAGAFSRPAGLPARNALPRPATSSPPNAVRPAAGPGQGPGRTAALPRGTELPRPGFAQPGAGFARPGLAPGMGPYRSPAAASWAVMRQRFYVPPPRSAGPPPGLGIGRTAHEQAYSGLPPRGETRFIPREVVVQVADTVPRADVEAAARRLGIAVVASHGFSAGGRTLYQLRAADGRDVRDVIRGLEQDRIVAAAQPNYVYRLDQAAGAPVSEGAAPAAAATAPEPPLPAGDPVQYTIEKLHLGEAHAQARGRNISIAVIDSDIDARHPDLHGAVVERFDPAASPPRPHLHGTGMAGAILSSWRLRGVAPAASVVAIKAFDERNAGPEATTFQILKGLDHAIQRGVRIINMSFAGPYDVMIERKLQEAYDKGIVLVAAAGNAGAKSPPLYPAADPNVIAVTATDRADKPFAQANRGNYVAIAAPGVDILVPAPNGAYQLTTGTSVAAAHVSGVIALMLEKRPDLTPDEVRAILAGSAVALPGTTAAQTGAGLVDPLKALTYEPPEPAEPAIASDMPAQPATPAAAAAAPTTSPRAAQPAQASGRAAQ